MTAYLDVADLMTKIYFPQATFDPHFLWKEIDAEAIRLGVQPEGVTNTMMEELERIGITYTEGEPAQWSDGFRRFRMLGCAHMHREFGVCTTCGNVAPDGTA